MLKAIIFDFDDTLVRYKDINVKCHQSAAKELKLKVPSKEELLSFSGKPWDKMIKSIWKGIDLKKFKKVYYKYANKLPRLPIKGIPETLKYLKNKDYKLFILSSKSKDKIISILKQVKIPLDYFTYIFGCEDIKLHKPSGEAFDVFLNKFNYSKKDVVYVGDSITDLEAAKNANIPFIGVLTGQCNRPIFLNNNIKTIINSVGELPRILDQDSILVKRETMTVLPTRYGEFRVIVYSNKINNEILLALLKGEPENKKNVLVRLHSQCFTGETLLSMKCDCMDQLHSAMGQISEKKEGVIIYLFQEGRGIGLMNKIAAYHLQNKGIDTFESNIQLGFRPDERDYWPAAQILKDLNINDINLLTNNPDKVDQLTDNGIIVEQTLIKIKPNSCNEKYLYCKKEKFNHML